MSLQHKVNSNLANRENLTAQARKQVVAPKLTTRRPALEELGNKIGNRVPINTKKEPVKVKTSALVIHKTDVTSKKTDIVAPLVRQESNLLKYVAQPANDNKVDDELAYSSKQLSVVIDLDAKDANNPSLVSEYIQDIINYLHSLEVKFSIKENYLENHRTKPHMRSILVNWIMEVHINFKFLLETLHLSVGILDRYLQLNKNVGQETLQLVGTAAVIIAAKYEEIYMPDIGDFVYICDNTFTKAQILKMEIDILSKLKFNLGRPLSIHFLRRYNKIAEIEPEHHNLAKYLLEICLLEHQLCNISPSLQAAAACCLSMSILNGVSDPARVWSKTLAHYTTYSYSAIKMTVKLLAYYLLKMEKSKFQVLRKKYSSSKLNKVSVLPELNCPLVQKLAHELQLLKK